MSPFREQVLTVIAQVCKQEEVRQSPDLDLFESGLLDSFAVVELLLALETELGVRVPITDFDREGWNTPNRIAERAEGYL